MKSQGQHWHSRLVMPARSRHDDQPVRPEASYVQYGVYRYINILCFLPGRLSMLSKLWMKQLWLFCLSSKNACAYQIDNVCSPTTCGFSFLLFLPPFARVGLITMVVQQHQVNRRQTHVHLELNAKNIVGGQVHCRK